MADQRLVEAKALLDQGMWDGAYYLAGYAVELALKACIIKMLQGSENWREIARALHIRYIFWGREETINYPASKQPWKTTATLIASGPWGAIYDLGLTTNQDE